MFRSQPRVAQLITTRVVHWGPPTMDEAGNPPCMPSVSVPAQGEMEQHCRFLSARSFLEKASGVKVQASKQSDLAHAVRDGELLCRVAFVLHGDRSLRHVSASNTDLKGEARVNENFSRFSLACATLHVHGNYVVSKNDVLSGNMPKLVNCILELERYAKGMHPAPVFPAPGSVSLSSACDGAPNPVVLSSTTPGRRIPSSPAASKAIFTPPLSNMSRTRRSVQHPGTPGTSTTPGRGGGYSNGASPHQAHWTPRTTPRSALHSMASLVGMPKGLLDLVAGTPGGTVPSPAFSSDLMPTTVSKAEAKACAYRSGGLGLVRGSNMCCTMNAGVRDGEQQRHAAGDEPCPRASSEGPKARERAAYGAAWSRARQGQEAPGVGGPSETPVEEHGDCA